MDAENGVEVYIEIGVVDLHGVDFQVVKSHGITGGLHGFGEELADKFSDIDLHLLGELSVQEGDEEDIEFA